MTAQLYSSIDANALGPSLETALNGQVLTANTNATDIHRAARCTLGKSSGVWYFEAVFYADNTITGAPVSLAGLGAVGIVTGSAALNKYVGEDANGIGYKVGDGGIFTNNTAMTGATTAGAGTTCSAANVPATSLTTWIGVLVDLGMLTATFTVNGSVYATVAIPSGKTWFPALTVCGNGTVAAYAVKAFINTGQRAFEFPQSTAGWYAISAAQPLPIYLTTDYEGGYTSANTDSPQNQIYGPRVLNADSLTFSRSCTVWPWSTSPPSSGTPAASYSSTFGSVTLDNFDGAFDYLLSQDMRDAQVAIKIIPAGGTVASAVTVATAIIDTVYSGGGSSLGGSSGAGSPAGEQTITLNLKDTLTRLQTPLQKKLFPPFADPGVANNPLPITLGAVRNIKPLLRTTDTGLPGYQHYQIHDAPLTAIATVRDKGTPLDPNATPPQYGPDAAPGQFYLATPPEGILTCDCSSMGSQVTIPGIADVLAGIGGFGTTWSGGAPPGWTVDSPLVIQQGTPQGFPANHTIMYVSTNIPWDPRNGKYGAHMHTTSAVLTPGQTYIITLKLYNTQGDPAILFGTQYGVVLCTALDGSAISSISPANTPLQVPVLGSGSYSFVYTCPTGAARPIYICVCATKGGTSGATARVSNLIVQQVGAYNAQQQLPLQGIDLTGYVQEVASRAGLTSAQIVTADTDAITAAIAAAAPSGMNWSRGYSIGQHFPAAVMADAALMAPLDSFCAVTFTDNLGRIRVRRLVDPAAAVAGGATIAAAFDITNTQYGVSAEPDYAPGLTTQIGARRNYAPLTNTDLVTDYVAVPGYLRTQFARTSQFIKQSSITPSNTYAFAQSVAPLDSNIDDPTQAQYEIDRVMSRYGAQNAQLPRFITFTICYDGTPPNLLFGDIVTLTYPRFGLNATPLLVKDTVLTPSMQTLQITAWG